MAAKYNTLPVAEVDTILTKFAKDLKNYPNTFIMYKSKEYRINKAHLNKVLDKITHPPHSETASIDDFISSFFYFVFCFLQTNDKDFSLGPELQNTFLEMEKLFKDFIGIDNDYWKQIFENADFSSSFQFIRELNLFPTYSRVFTDPYKDLKMFFIERPDTNTRECF